MLLPPGPRLLKKKYYKYYFLFLFQSKLIVLIQVFIVYFTTKIRMKELVIVHFVYLSVIRLSAFQERASTKASGLKAFKALVVLLRADSPDVFDVRWDGFCSLWFPTEPKVVEYVKNRYYSRKELWAPAFRKTTEISISNIVEVG